MIKPGIIALDIGSDYAKKTIAEEKCKHCSTTDEFRFNAMISGSGFPSYNQWLALSISVNTVETACRSTIQ